MQYRPHTGRTQTGEEGRDATEIMHAREANPEFSRRVPADELARPRRLTVEADAAERVALARRFGLPEIRLLRAEIRLVPVGEGVRLRARIEAEVVQSCVVTLEPVPARIEEEFSVLYRPGADGAELDVGGPEDEPVEPLPAFGLDVGEAVAQELSLALDPYPRAPGAATGDGGRP